MNPNELMDLDVALTLCEDAYAECTYKVDDIECWVLELPTYRIVLFRGTEADGLISKGGWRDIVTDLRAIPWWDNRIGWAHAGFLKKSRKMCEKHLIKELDPCVPTYVEGHSLGGALALASGIFLDAAGFVIAGVTTFGSPRVLLEGSLGKVKIPKKRIRQFSNRGDPVPKVPFRWWGYRHFNEIVIGVNKPLSLDNHEPLAYRAALVTFPAELAA